uniref:Protein ST7 homolog n=1 Tax=Romanomermis culicivorax TaxID=13658 RepID=A0A915KDN4_ROMCU
MLGRLKSWITWSWTYLWALWFLLVVALIYILRGPLKIGESLENATVYLNNLTPKFYVALTGTSSLVSGIILIFEWWYFKKYGSSFIESMSLSPFQWFGLGGAGQFGQNSNDCTGSDGEDSNDESSSGDDQFLVPECKVWRNPISLLRGAEYNRFTAMTGKQPLTYYDMNLSAQDHQNFFTCDLDIGKPEYEVMSVAWREREPELRIKAAKKALDINPDCATAFILLAEEECKTVTEAEQMFKRALKIAEVNYKKSHPSQTHVITEDLGHKRDTNVIIYIRRRLAICARRAGRLKDAVKIMRDLMKEFPMLNVMNIHENLIEALLEMQAYADAQAVLARFDEFSSPKSATLCYTAALLKARAVADKFSPDVASKKGLSAAELTAVEAIHKAVEFNPHVPKYLLEMKPLIMPPEHVLKRGDSEAIAYAFWHLGHWKRNPNSEFCFQTFRMIPYPLEKGHLFYPYPSCTEAADRELLPIVRIL